VVAYYRDSGGTEQERSIEQQRAAATEYCQRHGLVLVREFADEATPGSSVIGRDGFQAMIAWLRELAPEPGRGRRSPDAPDGYICWDMKRFSRDDLDSAFYRAGLRRRGYEPIFLSDNIPPGDLAPTFEAMLSWKAQQDLKDLSKDVRRGLRALITARGPDGQYLNLWPHKPPLGFRPERYEHGQRRDGSPRIVQRIVPDKMATWERVQMAFELMAQRVTVRRIHRQVALYKTNWGYRSMFRRRIYCGDLEWGGELFEDWIEPCVSRELWEQVEQQRVEDAQRSLSPRTGTGRYALSGWLRCGVCGGRMSGATSAATRSSGTYLYRRYKCATAYTTMNSHTNFYPHAYDIERQVYGILVREVLRPEAVQAMLEGTRPGDEKRDRLMAEVGRLGADVGRLDQQIGRLVDQVERYGPDAGIAKRLQERRRQKQAAAARIAKLERKAERTRVDPVPDEVIRAFCENTQEVLLHGQVAEVRAVLRQLVKAVTVWPDGRGLLRYVVAMGEEAGAVQEAEFNWCGE